MLFSSREYIYIPATAPPLLEFGRSPWAGHC